MLQILMDQSTSYHCLQYDGEKRNTTLAASPARRQAGTSRKLECISLSLTGIFAETEQETTAKCVLCSADVTNTTGNRKNIFSLPSVGLWLSPSTT